jgi:hypothetical protein
MQNSKIGGENLLLRSALVVAIASTAITIRMNAVDCAYPNDIPNPTAPTVGKCNSSSGSDSSGCNYSTYSPIRQNCSWSSMIFDCSTYKTTGNRTDYSGICVADPSGSIYGYHCTNYSSTVTPNVFIDTAVATVRTSIYSCYY